MTKQKQTFMFILGIILLPILFTLFILDRMILAVLFHLPSPSIQAWWRDSNEVGYSIIRILMTSSILGLGYIINMWI